jgi:hypothetical protein|tara:strand:+ start:168 stop:620 length:453 start_codon:yes stop_codon:yes gene_type:complete
MKKIFIITLSFMMYSCAIPISIGNRVVETPSATNKAETSVYASQSATMMAINHILPAKSAAFEMMNKTIILPAFKRNDIDVYNSLQFLAPEGQNEDGTYTFVYVASPYLEDKNYDILDVLVAEYGRFQAEEYFDIWLSCFAYEQEVMSFR